MKIFKPSEVFGKVTEQWGMFEMDENGKGFQVYGCDATEEYVILVNAWGKFILAKKYMNCLSIGAGSIKEYATYTEALETVKKKNN